MAHFAELNENNIVQRVIVINNDETLDKDGIEREAIGVAFCQSLFGGSWVKTSYNENMRRNFAAVGYTYDATRDAFIPPKPYDSWVLNETTCLWEAPTAYPTDGNKYEWNEQDQSWDLV